MPAQKKMNLQAVKMREKKDAKEPKAICAPPPTPPVNFIKGLGHETEFKSGTN
jgi:hypothetical protein